MKQYTSLEEFAAELPGLTADVKDKLAGKDSVFLLQTKQGRQWTIRLKNGIAEVAEVPTEKADCTVVADEKTLLDLINGKANPVTAILFGKVKIQGDSTRLMELIRLL